ncbi:protein-L-isoaspartate O-methyltransferase family protein [Sphingomicrobium nitratireducens]|uniref:protein-L-isoaspartate O-methyltransferase family protein n=1 Tax=Sphingomicrobium nitratireducens TaxID=2964666 RepID=UPI00223F9958|nr:protein-L-isoaspartate O-methyltransferase [Sphingomicrobium nitratireducens]
MVDTQTARRIMIDSQLRPQGVTDAAVLAAFAAVPREHHVPESAAAIAYRDRSVPLGEGRALIAPAALGAMLMEAAAKPGEKALVVGPGASYAAALLAEMGLEVVALDEESGPKTKGVTMKKGAFEKGAAKEGPYDLVLLVGAAEEMGDALVEQVVEGGRLVGGIFENGVTRLAKGVKSGGQLALRPFVDAQVPVIAAFSRPAAFAF